MHYLTDWQKREILDAWKGTQRTGTGGVEKAHKSGHPDHAVIDLCDRINKLEGFCTVQSCAGHKAEETKTDLDKGSGAKVVATVGRSSHGHLGVRMDQAAAKIYHRRSPDLVPFRGILEVGFKFDLIAGPVAMVQFEKQTEEGSWATRDRLARFFESLDAEATALRRRLGEGLRSIGGD